MKPLVMDKPLPKALHPMALCGSMACGGCYEIGDGKQIHPPRPEYDQAELAKLDGDEASD